MICLGMNAITISPTMGINPNMQNRPGEIRIQGMNIQGLNQGGPGMQGQQQPQRLNIINISGNPQQQQSQQVRNPNQMDIVNMAGNVQGQSTNQQPQQQQGLNPALVLNALSNVKTSHYPQKIM